MQDRDGSYDLSYVRFHPFMDSLSPFWTPDEQFLWQNQTALAGSQQPNKPAKSVETTAINEKKETKE